VSIVRNAPRKKKPSLIDTVKVPLRAGLHTIFKNPIAWINGIYSGLMFSIVTVFIALWAIPFLELSHHIHLLQATLVACALYTGVAVGGPVIGWLDGKKNWRKQMMVVNALGASGALFAVIFCHTLPLLAVAILLFFAGVCASSYVLTFAIANEIASPANRATCIGFTNMLCVAFAPILQPLIGFFIARSHAHPVFATTAQSITSFSDAVSVVPTLLLVAAAIGFFLPNKRYRHKQRA
jgi:MFS family permease